MAITPRTTWIMLYNIMHMANWKIVPSGLVPIRCDSPNTSVTCWNMRSIPHRFRYISSKSSAGNCSASQRLVTTITSFSRGRIKTIRRTYRRFLFLGVPSQPHSSRYRRLCRSLPLAGRSFRVAEKRDLGVIADQKGVVWIGCKVSGLGQVAEPTIGHPQDGTSYESSDLGNQVADEPRIVCVSIRIGVHVEGQAAT